MNKALISLLFALPLLAQFPQISTQGPARPTMQVGASQYNIGTATVYTGAGRPTTVSLSVVGDIYIDTTNKNAYSCVSGSNPCTTWQTSASPTEVPVTSFGVNGTAGTDPANMATAISAMAGKGCLTIPAGVTVNLSTSTTTLVIPSNTCILGQGENSIITGSATLASNGYVLGISNTSTNVELGGFKIEGACTTPVGVLYATAASNGLLWTNFQTGSSIAIGSGSSKISIHDVTINHTCGYSVLAAALTANITDVFLDRVRITNSRPNLFGSNASFLNYGSWTGGVLFYWIGTSGTTMSNVRVDHCTFQNVVGNALWTHAQALTVLSSNFSFTSNTFIDTGLDAIQIAGMDGYIETGNKSLRNGYVVTSDIGATRVGGPAWLQGFSPVSFDTSGKVVNAVRSGNEADAENGEGFDLDGQGMSVISNNKITSCFSSPDPLANAPACGPYNSPSSPICPGAGVCTGSGTGVNNFTRGLSSNNSNSLNDGQVGVNIAIIGNVFNGVGGGGIQGFALRNSVISGNIIDQPTTTSYSNPITLGNIGVGSFQHATGNLVTGNTAIWAPPSGSPMVFEDSTSAGSCSVSPFCPFFSTDVNTVRGNSMVGTNLYEFSKAAPDVSGTGALQLSSVTPGAGPITATVLQTEGPTGNPSLRMYANNGAGTLLGGFNAGGFQPIKYPFSSLPLASAFQGSIIYCTDCSSTSPCTGSGTGALAQSNGGTWSCGGSGGGGGISGSGTSNQVTCFTGTSSVGNCGISVSGGILNTPSGIVSSSGVQATGFNPTGFTGSTVQLQVGCVQSGGNCVSNYFAVVGGGSLPCPGGGPSNCTYYNSVDVTGGVVRGVH